MRIGITLIVYGISKMLSAAKKTLNSGEILVIIDQIIKKCVYLFMVEAHIYAKVLENSNGGKKRSTLESFTKKRRLNNIFE